MAHPESLAPYVRRELHPRAPLTLRPEEVHSRLSDAYVAVREANRDADFGAAWKLGGTTAKTRELFRVDALYFGALHSSELLIEPAVAPASPICALQGEVEVALRIAEDGESFDRWCVAVEMPASPIENMLEAGAAALIADRCAAGCLVLGSPRALDELPGGSRFDVEIRQDGEVISQASPGELLGSPMSNAVEFLGVARAHGFSPRPGQWVATGGLCPCVPLSPGARVEVRFQGDVAFSFVVAGDAE